MSILYADLFNKAIPSSELNDLDNLTLAFGDKGLMTELYLTKYMQRGDVILPTNEEMRANTEAFIEDAFIRFYLRNPTAYEKRFLTEQITNDPELTPRLIYISFALANEYYFY